MKIGDKSRTDPTGLIERLGCDPVRPLGNGDPRRNAVDQIQVSDVARALARLLGRFDQSTIDPVRAAQLEILRNAVSCGRYQPDLHEVARRLLTEVAAERGR
jgi:anti-sigma-28 factor FlgM